MVDSEKEKTRNGNDFKPQYLDPSLYYADNSILSFSRDAFLVEPLSGGMVRTRYIFSPSHMKSVSELLQKKIEEYEKEFGDIN